MTTRKFYTYEDLKKEYDIEDPTVGSMLKNHRECEELTQTQLAKILGISKSHLSDIENGRKFVSIERAKDFARRLGDSENYFVFCVIRELLKRANHDCELIIKSKSS